MFSFTRHAYGAGGGSSTDGAPYRVSRDERAVSESRADCALDVSNLDVRVGYWCGRVPDAV